MTFSGRALSLEICLNSINSAWNEVGVRGLPRVSPRFLPQGNTSLEQIHMWGHEPMTGHDPGRGLPFQIYWLALTPAICLSRLPNHPMETTCPPQVGGEAFTQTPRNTC